jgi:hypothetical protein
VFYFSLVDRTDPSPAQISVFLGAILENFLLLNRLPGKTKNLQLIDKQYTNFLSFGKAFVSVCEICRIVVCPAWLAHSL